MKTSEALGKAAGIMRRLGFCRDTYQNDAGNVCFLGALSDVAGDELSPPWWMGACGLFCLAIVSDADFGASNANDGSDAETVVSAIDEAARIAESAEWTDRAWKVSP